jgi:hypothetical protein
VNIQCTNIAKGFNFEKLGVSTLIVRSVDQTPLAIFIEVAGGTAAECVVMKTAADPDFAELLALNGVCFNHPVQRVVLSG